jgi:hypothetical protein
MQSAMNTSEANFMAMLDEANVGAGSRWSDVQRQLAKDERFQAVVGEHKLVLFHNYVRTRRDIDDMRLDNSEKEFMVRPLAGSCSAACFT